jgi:hypothetical protein
MIRKTSFAIAALLVLGSAPAAFADESNSNPVPVADPTSQSQNSPEAQSEAASANAAAPANINDVKSRGAAEIAKRQKSLADAAGKLAAQTTDCGYNAAMGNEIKNTSVSLATVGVNLAGTVDPAAAKTLLKSIFIDHRVYALVLPKAGKVLRCDAILARTAAITTNAATFQTKLDAAKTSGVDTTAAQAGKNTAMTLLGTVNPAPIVAPIMGLVPDKGVDTVLASNRTALQTADAGLDAAVAVQKSVHQQLETARKTLAPAVKADKKDDNEKEKEAKKAERDAKKAQKESEKQARRAARDAKKNEKKNEKKSSDNKGDDNDSRDNND